MIRSSILLAVVWTATLGAQPPARPKGTKGPERVVMPRPPKGMELPEKLEWQSFELMHEAPLPPLGWREPLLRKGEMPFHEFTPPTPLLPGEWTLPPMPVDVPFAPQALKPPKDSKDLKGPKDFKDPKPGKDLMQLPHAPELMWHPTPHAPLSENVPRAWAPEDPADSLYRRARELLNRGEYRQAAGAFREISAKFATSQYAASALYWQAFALYRIGGVAELREALTALETQRTKYPSAKTESDVGTLQARILGALAQRGDAGAQRQLAQAAQQGQTCDNDEDQGVRVEALRALYQSDPETVAPLIQQVLNRKDECSVQLRRNAIFLIGNRRDQTATGVGAHVARPQTAGDGGGLSN
jgi:TolA-binding protein